MIRARGRRALASAALAPGLLAAALLLAPPGPEPSPALSEEGTANPPVASVGGDLLRASDLVRFWYRRHPEAWIRTVEEMVEAHVVAREARRLGLDVPSSALDRAVAEEVDARRAQLAETYGEAVDLAEEVRRAYGLDLATWQRDVLRPRLRAHLLLARVVRLDARRRSSLKVRVIVLEEEAKALQVLAKLRAGADFSLTALQESVDPTGQAGGDLPPFGRGDLAFPEVEARLFEAPAGSLVGPLPVDADGVRRWHLYKVIERLEPWRGPWPRIAARLEADLTRRPVSRAEYERWRERMRRDVGVRLYDPEGRVLGPLPGPGR